MPRYLTTKAIVVNHRRSLESDEVITLLTESLGKVVVNAKGVKSNKSHRQGSLELGNLIKTQLYEKNDRYWLADTVVLKHTLLLTKSLTQLNLIFYFLEITNHFIAENQHLDNVFSITCALLESVNKNDFATLIRHEIQLLEALGFGVPEPITLSYQKQDYPESQKQIKLFLESIIERPLHSSKLFK
ncbi:DNA repair protein RecO [Candidatus Shapirobacteria bacterium]|nr:DNA repair protein RecO [Candidatus Shapirobacteria bacterium]